jgi:hypothetical protein
MCLREFEAQLAPSSSKPGVLSTATGLTLLQLDDCLCTDGWVGLDSIAALTNLRCLMLKLKCLPGRAAADGGSAGDSSSNEWAEALARGGSVFLSSLLQLTSLDLFSNMNGGTLQPLSRLTNLQKMCLVGVEYTPGVDTWLERSSLQCLQQLSNGLYISLHDALHDAYVYLTTSVSVSNL